MNYPAALLAAAVSVFATIPAVAQVAVSVVQDQPVVLQLQELDKNLKAEIEDQRDKIIKALKGHSEQGSEYIKQQMEAASRIADAAALNAAMLQKSVARATAESGAFDPSSSQCETASALPSAPTPANYPSMPAPAGATGASADTSGAAGIRSGAGGGVWTAVDAMNDVRNRSRGNGDPNVRAGGPALAKSILDQRDKYQNTLGVLDPTTDARALLDNRTVPNSAGAREAQALNSLNVNLLEPFPPPAMTANQAQTPEGVMETARREIVRARRSTALAVVEQIIGDQMGSIPTASVAIPPNYPDKPSGDKVSEHQWLDMQVWGKFQNPEWYTKP